MNGSQTPKMAAPVRRGGCGMRLMEDAATVAEPERRAFLRLLAQSGVSIPAAYFMADGVFAAQAQPVPDDPSAPAAKRLRGDAGPEPGRGHIVRDFADPYIELIRLLREAAEVEHSLMIQYLYAAFSVKPAYAAIAGYGAPNANDLLGVAIQEMQHLGQVNRLLVKLGATPNLLRQSFPYEPAIYPFAFNLEPLGLRSLAKYVYSEAPAGVFVQTASPAERAFTAQIEQVLGPDARPNHVGSLYATVIGTLEEYIASAGHKTDSLKPWVAKLEQIKLMGEDEHFRFFRRLFAGTHEGFKGHPAIWSLAPTDPAYPAFVLPVNPSAYVGHENQILNPLALSLAWLGDLHYWTILLLADFSLTEDRSDYLDLAKQHMLGPFVAIARHLPHLGAGIPCDPLSMGYAPCHSPGERVQFISSMVREADTLAHELKDRLPGDYPIGIGADTLAALGEQRRQYTAAGG